MKYINARFTVGVLAVALSGVALAADVKPADQIQIRQAGYRFMSWNMGKIKANLEGSFDAKQVTASANVIAAIANSGMGALYGPGTDKDIGDVHTNVKPEFFEKMPEVGKLAGNFVAAADNLAKVAATGDAAAVKTAFGDLGKSCKACHDQFRAKD
ncbi:cytochrome c [uncultured Thiodictyon sp.]|uniref:c-type cytochrome n=1 Tax=uncultured Thiodictyon sp. TaxID=1846217 RepID=UPI0025E96D2F|nr:cytochrome c [uncultured Thiodictyon sp.]